MPSPPRVTGIGEKLLEKMGYHKGQGLGNLRQGIVDPISVTKRASSKLGIGFSQSMSTAPDEYAIMLRRLEAAIERDKMKLLEFETISQLRAKLTIIERKIDILEKLNSITDWQDFPVDVGKIPTDIVHKIWLPSAIAWIRTVDFYCMDHVNTFVDQMSVIDPAFYSIIIHDHLLLRLTSTNFMGFLGWAAALKFKEIVPLEMEYLDQIISQEPKIQTVHQYENLRRKIPLLYLRQRQIFTMMKRVLMKLSNQ